MVKTGEKIDFGENIFHTPGKRKTTEIDVSRFPIYLPPEGIFVGLEKLNCYSYDFDEGNIYIYANRIEDVSEKRVFHNNLHQKYEWLVYPIQFVPALRIQVR